MKTITINDYEMPGNVVSDHQKLNIESIELKRLKQVLLHTLAKFHQFSCQKDIDYSLIAGSLIGYYGHAEMLPWDDDIDVEIHPNDVVKLSDLWGSGETPISIENYQRGFNNQHTKIVTMCDEKFEMMIDKPGFQYKKGFLVKFRPVNHDCFNHVPGGLDITTSYIDDEGNPTDAWDKGVGINPKYINNTDCPVIEFGGVSTRAVKFDVGKNYLTEKYGEKWCIKRHPTIK